MIEDETDAADGGPPYDPDDMEHLRERTEQYRKLVEALAQIAGSDLPEWTVSERATLDDRRWTMSCGSEELLESLAQVNNPGERGDIVDRVIDLVDAAFEIGRYAKPAQSALLAGVRIERTEAAKRAGSKSGTRRREESEKWKIWALEAAGRNRNENPGIGPEQLATLIHADQWPPTIGRKREWRTVLDYIRSVEKNGTLPRRLRKL